MDCKIVKDNREYHVLLYANSQQHRLIQHILWTEQIHILFFIQCLHLPTPLKPIYETYVAGGSTWVSG